MTEIVVAVIAGGAVLGAAWIPTRTTRKAVGKPNGQGTVVQMLEKVIERQGAHGERLDTLDERMKRLEQVHGLEVKE